MSLYTILENTQARTMSSENRDELKKQNLLSTYRHDYSTSPVTNIPRKEM